MKQIISPSSLISSILGMQKFDESKTYRPIYYIIDVSIEDGVLIRNQLTLEMLLLDYNEYEICFVKKDKYNILFHDLVKKWFFVPQEFNDDALKTQIRNLIPLFKKSATKRTYSILPTLDCNARCFYCFENNTPKISMSEQTADNVINYIINTCNEEDIAIQWFGGEPLYNLNIINRIIDGLIASKINFVSTMTTNGYLFDENIVDIAKKKWNLKRVQITLDGTEEIYNKIKSYIYVNDESPFQKVIHNIHLLLNAGIRVNIRINIERHNLNDVDNLIDVIHREFIGHKDLHIYPALLFDDCGVSLKTRTEDIHKELLQHSIHFKQKLFKLGYYKDKLETAPKVNSCMADSHNTVIILPNGNLSRCERITDEKNCGDIYGSMPNNEYISSWRELANFEDCKTCPIGLDCMHLKKCPTWGHHNCASSTQKTIISSKQFAMRNEYQFFLNRNTENTEDRSQC